MCYVSRLQSGQNTCIGRCATCITPPHAFTTTACSVSWTLLTMLAIHPAFHHPASLCFLSSQVMGPLLGGALSQVWGWRSTFMALAAFAGLAGAAVMLLIRTETHQHFVLKRLAKDDPDAAKSMQEWDSVISHPPVFSAPWVPLQ